MVILHGQHKDSINPLFPRFITGMRTLSHIAKYVIQAYDLTYYQDMKLN